LKRAAALAALATALAFGGPSYAGPDPDTAPEQAFAGALQALDRGAYDQAIDRLELLADQGFRHPDASFNRAAAYVERAESPHARPGDLGRAAAALSEALLLRPGDAEAETALEGVHAEIARRRLRQGAEPVTARPSLARAVVGLLPENVWALGAAFGSLALTLGLAARLFFARARAQLSGTIAAWLGALLLAVCGSLTAAARHFRGSSSPAVVVAAEARLLDEHAKPMQRKDGLPEQLAIPEGASVELYERRGQLARVEWGTTTGWVSVGQLRVLARP